MSSILPQHSEEHNVIKPSKGASLGFLCIMPLMSSWGFILRTSSNPNYLPKGPPPDPINVQIWRLSFQHVDFGGIVSNQYNGEQIVQGSWPLGAAETWSMASSYKRHKC